MPDDREIAGIRCMSVLELLSDYLEGDLSPERVNQIEEHLGACSWCETFGREFAATVAGLRRQLGLAEPLDPAISERLARALEQHD